MQQDASFLEISFFSIPDGFSEILMAELAEAGFDSFSEKEQILLAYIQETCFDENAIYQVIRKYTELNDLSWTVNRVPGQNWNKVWERQYPPVLIAGRCYIRAPFHPPMEARIHKETGPLRQRPSKILSPVSRIPHSVSYIEIIIEPRMTFGTAHHETTALMIGWVLKETVTGKKVLDMGCGTGVIAILAFRMGARQVVAIDKDPWATDNARENALKNNAGAIHVIQGDVRDIPSGRFDLILANINRNALLEHIPFYAGAMGKGSLLVSGFFTEDLPGISKKAENNGFYLVGSQSENNWTIAKFTR